MSTQYLTSKHVILREEHNILGIHYGVVRHFCEMSEISFDRPKKGKECIGSDSVQV